MHNPPQIAVILSGCGNKDGAEIHESVLTLWAIHKHGARYQCFAPDITQHHVLNFITGKEMDESRNVLLESARIARGNIKDLATFRSDEFDALIIPGGLGVAKNLSNFASAGADCIVNDQVTRAIQEMAASNKPIGALCIAPAIVAKILKDVELTIGNDPATAEKLEQMGAIHRETTHGEIIVDRRRKVVSTPCYMLDARVDQIGDGADNLVKAVLGLVD